MSDDVDEYDDPLSEASPDGADIIEEVDFVEIEEGTNTDEPEIEEIELVEVDAIVDDAPSVQTEFKELPEADLKEIEGVELVEIEDFSCSTEPENIEIAGEAFPGEILANSGSSVPEETATFPDLDNEDAQDNITEEDYLEEVPNEEPVEYGDNPGLGELDRVEPTESDIVFEDLEEESIEIEEFPGDIDSTESTKVVEEVDLADIEDSSGEDQIESISPEEPGGVDLEGTMKINPTELTEVNKEIDNVEIENITAGDQVETIDSDEYTDVDLEETIEKESSESGEVIKEVDLIKIEDFSGEDQEGFEDLSAPIEMGNIGSTEMSSPGDNLAEITEESMGAESTQEIPRLEEFEAIDAASSTIYEITTENTNLVDPADIEVIADLQAPENSDETNWDEQVDLQQASVTPAQEIEQSEETNLRIRQDLETYYQELADYAAKMKDNGLDDRFIETQEEMQRVSGRLNELTQERLKSHEKNMDLEIDKKSELAEESLCTSSDEQPIVTEEAHESSDSPLDTQENIETFDRPCEFGVFAHQAYKAAAYDSFDDVDEEVPVIIKGEDGSEQQGYIDNIIDDQVLIDYKTHDMRNYSSAEAEVLAENIGKKMQEYVKALGDSSEHKGYIISTVPPESNEVRKAMEATLAKYDVRIIFSESEQPEDVIKSVKKAVKDSKL